MRPEGWHKTVKEICGEKPHPYDVHYVEAGADAMIEGLKKEGIFLDVHDCHNFINRTKTKGYLVFIEE